MGGSTVHAAPRTNGVRPRDSARHETPCRRGRTRPFLLLCFRIKLFTIIFVLIFLNALKCARAILENGVEWNIYPLRGSSKPFVEARTPPWPPLPPFHALNLFDFKLYIKQVIYRVIISVRWRISASKWAASSASGMIGSTLSCTPWLSLFNFFQSTSISL